MENVIELNGGYYPYSKIVNHGKNKLQIKIKVGTYANGRDKFITTSADNEIELKEALKKMLSKNVVDSNSSTVEQLSNEWLSYKFNSVAPATYDKIDSVIQAHIIPKIGKEYLNNVNESFLNQYISYLSIKGNQRTKTPKGLSYNTIKKIISVLKEMFEYAYRADYVERNYAKYIVIPKRTKQSSEKKILNDNELTRFLNELNKKNNNNEYVYYYRNAVLFMLLTGLRTCEVFALEKDCVDFDKRIIKVKRNRIRIKNRDVSGERIEGYTTTIVNETKNKSSERVVPLTNAAYSVLKDACEKSECELCFPNQRGEVVKPTTFSQKFKKITDRAKVDITPYSLRHTFATNFYYNTELSIDKLARILGHTTPKVTYNTYIHQIETKEMKFADEFENMFGRNVLS